MDFTALIVRIPSVGFERRVIRVPTPFGLILSLESAGGDTVSSGRFVATSLVSTESTCGGTRPLRARNKGIRIPININITGTQAKRFQDFTLRTGCGFTPALEALDDEGTGCGGLGGGATEGLIR